MSALDPREQEALRRICRKLGKGGEELREERSKKAIQKESGKRETEHAAS
jgi:hypothetical protein